MVKCASQYGIPPLYISIPSPRQYCRFDCNTHFLGCWNMPITVLSVGANCWLLGDALCAFSGNKWSWCSVTDTKLSTSVNYSSNFCQTRGNWFDMHSVTSAFVDNTMLLISVWTVAASSIDKFYMVQYPLNYHRSITWNRVTGTNRTQQMLTEPAYSFTVIMLKCL